MRERQKCNVMQSECFVGASMSMCRWIKIQTRLGVRRLVRLVVHQIVKYVTGEELQK